MSDKYQGKCSLKKWQWRPTKSEAYPDDLRVGETYVYVETKRVGGFRDLSDVPDGTSVVKRDAVLEFRTEYSESRKTCIALYLALKTYLETSLHECDRAVIASRKSPRQVQLLKCGLK